MPDRDWSTLATLPLARAKASRVNSASGVTQQLGERRTQGGNRVSAFPDLVNACKCVGVRRVCVPSEKEGIGLHNCR